jgi:hypothetical protein
MFAGKGDGNGIVVWCGVRAAGDALDPPSWTVVPNKALSLSLSFSLSPLDFGLWERRFRLLMRTRHGHLQDQKTLGSRLGSLY